MAKTVTIECSTNPQLIGDAATRDDLYHYYANLTELLSREFGVQIHRVNGSSERTECRESEEIRERIREIESGDEWIQLLSVGEKS